jgi:hypothetical protein
VVAGLQEQNVHIGLGAHGQVDEHRVLHVRRDDEPVAERPRGPVERFLGGRLGQLGGRVLGERPQVGGGGHLRAPLVATACSVARFSPANLTVNTRRQPVHSQAACGSSCGRRSSSPQYGQ